MYQTLKKIIISNFKKSFLILSFLLLIITSCNSDTKSNVRKDLAPENVTTPNLPVTIEPIVISKASESDSLRITRGGSIQLVATTKDISGTEVNCDVVWSSSDDKNAVVSDTGFVIVSDNATYGSEVAITATLAGDETKSASVKITIIYDSSYVDNAFVFYSSAPSTLRTDESKINWEKSNAKVGKLEYCITNSKNPSDWSEWDGSKINAGTSNANPESDKYFIFLRGEENVIITHFEPSEAGFVLTSLDSINDITIDGNIMNLLDYRKDYTDSKNLEMNEYDHYCTFNGIFANNKTIRALGDNFSLPATNLQFRAYRSMFKDCTSLETLPEKFSLPSKTLGKGCYESMFSGCSSLTTLLDNFTLPATKLERNCYTSMFNGCSSLKSLLKNFNPPAVELIYRCYNKMFYGCSSLIFEKNKSEDADYRQFIDLRGISTNDVEGPVLEMFLYTGSNPSADPETGDVWYIKK